MDKYDEFLDSTPGTAVQPPQQKDHLDEFLDSEPTKKSGMGDALYQAASDAVLPGLGAGARVMTLPKDKRKEALETTGMALGSMGGTALSGPVGSVAGGAAGSAAGTAIEKGAEQLESGAKLGFSKKDLGDIEESARRGGTFTALGEGAGLALKGGFKAGAALAEKYSPALYKALASIPPNATRMAIRFRDVLENKALGTAESVDQAVQKATKVFKNAATDYLKGQSDTALVSKKIVESDFGKLQGTLEAKNLATKQAVEQTQKELGVYSEFSEAEKKILKSAEQKRGRAGREVPSKDQVGSLVETIHDKFNSGQLNRNQALKSLESLDNVAEGYNKELISKVKDVISNPPTEAAKAGTSKDFFNRLVDLYHTPGEIPKTEAAGHVKNVTRIINYVDQNAEKMNPADAGYALLGAKRALHTMENWSRESKDAYTSNFIKYQYGKLNETMKRLPGFQKLLDAQESAHMAMTMRETLDKVMQSPDALHSFLKDAFEGVGSPKSRNILMNLQALEQEAKEPLIDNLMAEYEIRKNALEAKFPFNDEFESPATGQKFLEGLFKMRGINSSDAAIAEEKIRQLESFPGMKNSIHSVEKNFSAREFKPFFRAGIPHWEMKAILAAPLAIPYGMATNSRGIEMVGGLGAGYAMARSPMMLGKAITAGRTAAEVVPAVARRAFPVASALLMGDSDQNK